MLKWSFKFIDTVKSTQPTDFLQRVDGQEWVYLNSPVSLIDDTGLSWLKVISGDAVRIPLHPYVTTNRDPAIALATLFQIGTRAALDWHIDQINQIHLAIGIPVEEITNYVEIKPGKKVDCFRFWLGLAMRLKKI